MTDANPPADHVEALAAMASTHDILGSGLAKVAEAISVITREHERIGMQLRGMSSEASVTVDGAWHSVWLHGNWRQLTRNMTTEQREVAADGVERYWDVLHDGTEDDVHPETRAHLRWWRD